MYLVPDIGGLLHMLI